MFKHLKSVALICMLIYTSPSNVHAQDNMPHPVSAKRTPEGYTLSLNVHNLPLEELLEELSNQCKLRFITYEDAMLSQPLTIRFRDLPLEQGIKQLLKAADIKNYFIQYRNDQQSKSNIAVVTLLGKGTKAGEIPIIGNFTKKDTNKEGISPHAKSIVPEDEFTEKITALKERYEWADRETEELAVYLLELMPEPERGPGMEALMNELDWRIAAEGNEAVDEEIFFQALENTVPPHLAPAMMDSIKQYSQRYKAGTLYDGEERPSNQLYQEVMIKRPSNRNNNLKGGSSYDYESP